MSRKHVYVQNFFSRLLYVFHADVHNLQVHPLQGQEASPVVNISAHTSRAKPLARGQTFRTEGKARLPAHTLASLGFAQSLAFPVASPRPIRREQAESGGADISCPILLKPILPMSAQTFSHALVTPYVTGLSIPSLFGAPPHHFTTSF